MAVVNPRRYVSRMSYLEPAILAVERYWFEGRQSLEENPGRLPYRSGLTTSERQKLSLQRKFADPEHGYGPEQFRRLIAEFRNHEHALTPSAIGKLMGVAPGSKRNKLITDAIKQQWPLSRIEQEIKLSGLTKARTDGRAVKPPHNLSETLARLEASYCPSWLRLLESIEHNPSAKLPTSLTEKIQTAKDAISNLLATAKRLRDGKS